MHYIQANRNHCRLSMRFRWRVDRPAARYILAITILAGLILVGIARAASPSNAQSPMGINLQGVSYFTSEQPFLNIFKTAGSWTTHATSQWDTSEQSHLNLDANGWPISLTALTRSQKFDSVGVLLLRDLPQTSNGFYPAGQYIVLYEGQGTLSYGFDASLVRSSPGRDVINVPTPSTAGIDLRITSTDPNHTGNYLRNIQLVKAENEALLKRGQIFSPAFLSILQNFKALRFMDWFATNGSTLSSWSKRPLPANAFWGSSKGVPIEVAIQLANALSADAWLTVPVMADDNFMTEMATLVSTQLGPSQKAYIELSNEVWNGGFSQNAYSIEQGKRMFPNAVNKWYSGWEWYGMRTAQMADTWYRIYGKTAFDSRVVIVMAGQAVVPEVLVQEMSTPDWTGPGNGPAASHHIGAAAIAPYFLGSSNVKDVESVMASSDGFRALFATAYASGGWIDQVGKQVTSHLSALSSYNLPLVAYEGGQALQAMPHYNPGSPQYNFFAAANRDPRMASAYTTYLNRWKSSGGTLFMHYNDTFPSSVYGDWGLLESIMQTTDPLSSAPPKWQAVQNFINSNSCWWSGCAGALGAMVVPQAPANLKVQ